MVVWAVMYLHLEYRMQLLSPTPHSTSLITLQKLAIYRKIEINPKGDFSIELESLAEADANNANT